MKIWSKMLFLGDSLTSGARDPYDMSWPFYMTHLAIADDYVLIPEVEALPGRTSSQLLRMALPFIEKTAAPEVFILIGTNDAKDTVDLPVGLYMKNIAVLVNACKAFSKREYVLTLPEPAGFGSPNYSAMTTERVKAYNQALRDSALTTRLIELRDIATWDGIHLSYDGAREVAKRTWAAIKRERSFS